MSPKYHVYMPIYIYMCVCVCVCVYLRYFLSCLWRESKEYYPTKISDPWNYSFVK